MTSVDECVTCGAGTYCPVGSIKPVDCAPGTFNPNVSQALCRRCSAGTYQDKEGALECKTCDPGRAPDPDLTSTQLMCSQSPQLYPQLKPQLAPKQSVDPSVLFHISGYYCEEGAPAAVPCPGGTVRLSHQHS